MILLLDQGLPRSCIAHLREQGTEAEHVADIGLSCATDSAILDAAVDRGAIIVTLDSDFHAILARSRAMSPSVVRIRTQGLKARQVVDMITKVLERSSAELLAGAVVSVDAKRIRVRRLPIGRETRRPFR